MSIDRLWREENDAILLDVMKTFLTYMDCDRGAEEYKGWGVFLSGKIDKHKRPSDALECQKVMSAFVIVIRHIS